MIQMTAAGAQARSLARWAWQDPQARAIDALEQVNELAARQDDPQARAEIQDAATMLSRLASSVNEPERPRLGLVSTQLAMPMTISEQIDLTAIGHRHVPGTPYTFRHGWIPVAGAIVNDNHPAYVHEGRIRSDAVKDATEHAKVVKNGDQAPPVPVASSHKLTPEQKAQARAARLAPQSSSPAAPRAAAPRPSKSAKASAAVFEQHPYAEAAADMHARAMGIVPPPPAAPGTAGEALAKSDPALASLAAPGMSAAALKSYIDARVAAEVARQMGQISPAKNKEIQAKLAHLHQAQQRTIALVRKQYTEGNEKADGDLRKHTVMNNIFALAGVGVAIAGLATGMSPVLAAIAAGVVPIANTIHDYARNLG